MFQIDKKKFGTFLSRLRKEKGYTQKDLAQKLLISDKAVSKWETGVSFPDTQLLIPMAQLLGVTVTELLLCQRMEKEKAMDAQQVETVVKTALTCSEEAVSRAYQEKSKWPLVYLLSAVMGGIGALICYQHHMLGDTLIMSMVFGLVFGAYFCFFVKTRLPVFYDENRCGLYYDGAFRLNVPGVVFNNSNWPHIVRVGRIWSCLSLALYPLISGAMSVIAPEAWTRTELYVFLVLLLGGLFIPIYAVGKKYE